MAPKKKKMKSYLIPEERMIPVITKNREIICPGTNYSSKEVDSGFGIADVVFYNLDKCSTGKRQKTGIPRIKSFEILETLSVINSINTKKINITQLYKKLPYSENIFRKKILNFLLTNGIAELIDDDYLNIKYYYKISLKETVAIEAKVCNWKRGLYQAYRYKQYSDYSYLAIDINHIKSPKNNIDLFKKFNVGLISVDTKNGIVDLIYKPEKDKNIFSNWIKYYANESILTEGGFLF